jgi:hypothetical protein
MEVNNYYVMFGGDECDGQFNKLVSEHIHELTS